MAKDWLLDTASTKLHEDFAPGSSHNLVAGMCCSCHIRRHVALDNRQGGLDYLDTGAALVGLIEGKERSRNHQVEVGVQAGNDRTLVHLQAAGEGVVVGER